MSFSTVQWSVSPAVQGWLELNPEVRQVRHPAGVEGVWGLSLIGWNDAEIYGERKRVREREKDHSGEISSLHS